MRLEHHYRWRTLWLGKWTTTRHHCTEDDIRVEHPEADRIEGTLIVREVPETDEERAAHDRAMKMSPIAPGPTKAWER